MTLVLILNCTSGACFKKPESAFNCGEIWYSLRLGSFEEAAEGRRKYNPQVLYQYIQRHSDITDWFNRKGYRTSLMPYANDLEEHYAFHPLIVQRLLMGRPVKRLFGHYFMSVIKLSQRLR